MNKKALATPSVVVLILANFIPLWGVIFRDWDVMSILYLYWAENITIGVVNVLKLLTNRAPGTPLSSKLFLAPFFAVHYGFFCFGHAMFVFGGMIAGTGDLFSAGDRALAYLTDHPLLIAGFFASHLFSFFFNYLGRGENKTIPIQKVMFLPYGRIVILHVTIIIGGMALVALGNPTVLVAILILLKTGGDIFFHLRERRKVVR